MRDKVPALRKPAPIFQGTAVVNGQFKEISLEDYFGKYVVLFFYPLNFSYVCPTEILSFSEHFKDFKKCNTVVIGCSTDNQFSHLAWINTPKKDGGLGNIDIPLLSDKTQKIAKMYGILEEADEIAFRAAFIIDDKGILRQISINDMPVGRSVDEILRLVQAYQYADATGDLCPIDWRPGKDGIKAVKEEQSRKK